MTKRQGSRNYTRGEMECLLRSVQFQLPATQADWVTLAAGYNAEKAPHWQPRDPVSLKRKFRSMCVALTRAGTELAAFTKHVQGILNQRRAARSSQLTGRDQAESSGGVVIGS
jgi:hypothetical protein